jgi:hypothetical protein
MAPIAEGLGIGPETVWNGSNEAQVARVDPLAAARRAREAYWPRRRDVQKAIRATGDLFGPAVANAVSYPVELVTDAAGDAMADYEAAITERDETIAEIREQLDVERTAHAETKARSWAIERILVTAMGEAERRARRTKSGALPGWHATAAELLLGDRDLRVLPQGEA